MITKLTPEQEAKLPEYRERWIKIGRSCEPCDFEKAKAAAIKAYECAGEKPPKDFYLVDSPKAGVELACKLKGITNPTKEQYETELRAQVFGSHDASWLSFYAFFRDECGLEACKRLDGLIELAEHCGWWAPYDTCAILQHRHTELYLDDEERLHNESGMAVRYRDDTGVYAIHGVVVNEQIIMRPETQTVDQIQKEQNEEVKRIRIERYGWGNYLKGINAKVLDERRNDVEATDEALMSGDGMTVLICACPSTAKVFSLEVSPDCKTCEEAQNYLRGGYKMNVIGAT